MRTLSEETGDPRRIPLDGAAACLDSCRQEALIAEAQNRGALSRTTGSGDGHFAELCDKARLLHDAETGGSIVVTCVRTGP